MHWSGIRSGNAPQDLNTLIAPSVEKTLLLLQAVGINNDCSIVVNGAYYNPPTGSSFLLTLNDPSMCANGVL
jgi:hypothetical protein